MSGAHCLVERACVHTGSADDGPRWRFLLEDALRTAEFGDAGRLVVVRRLRLTGLPARPAPGQAARALELAWAAQVRQAVPAVAPGAAVAPAVWFASRQQAQAAWLVAWAEDDAALLAQWYWPAALELPVLHMPDAAPPALAALVWRAAQSASPLVWRQQVAAWPGRRLATLARRWAGAGVLPPTAGPAPASERLANDGVRDAATTPAAPATATVEPALPAAAVAVLGRLQAQATLPPAAQAWLAALWLGQALQVADPPAALLRAVLVRWRAGAAEPVAAAATPPHGATPVATPQPAAPLRTQPPAPAAEAGASVRAAGASASTPAQGRSPALRLEGLVPSTRHPALERLAAARPWLADGQASTHGGLLFLLNLLPALRFPAWLATQPDATAFVDRLFLHLLDATGAGPDDPQRAWFDPGLPPDDPRLRGWRLRLRRALRRRVRLDLGDLVRRAALVQATPTHLDLVFPLDEVDLRLRRAGLDLDPGWVPWFGRIVAFHFL